MPAGLVQLRQLLREEQLIPWASASAAPPVWAPCVSTTASQASGYSKGGLSSISVGGPGASFNSPVARSGGARTTVGLPGTGLSWSVEHTPSEGLPNSRRLRPGQLAAFKQSLLDLLRQELFAPGSPGALLWEHGSVSRLLAQGSLGARMTGLLALIETPEAMEGYLLRAQSQSDGKRRAQRSIEAAQEAVRLAGG